VFSLAIDEGKILGSVSARACMSLSLHLISTMIKQAVKNSKKKIYLWLPGKIASCVSVRQYYHTGAETIFFFCSA